MFTYNQINAFCLICMLGGLICHQISQTEYDSKAGKVFWWLALISLLIGFIFAVILTAYPE